MEYRNQEIRHRLEKVGRAASMLHLGGSTIAAATGARESGKAKKIISVEPRGRLKHFRLPTKNIFKDLKKNLARFGVLEDVTLINGFSFAETTASAVRQILGSGEVGLFMFDADHNVRRDLDCYGDLLSNDCWVVIDDYFGPGAKAAPIRAQVDELVSTGKLVPFGYHGWGTWIGKWRT
jgi:predicted O-methyltransferase YrrM